MKSLRAASLILLASGAMCLLIGYERYYSAVETGKALANQLQGIEFESIRTPRLTIVCLGLGVMLLVAGFLCGWEWWKQRGTDGNDGLLKRNES